MSKPINRKKQKRTYRLIGLGSYLAVFYFALHLSYICPQGDFTLEDILAAMEGCFSVPFAMSFDNTHLIMQCAMFGLIFPLLIHAEYLRKRDLRPSEESGSAKWNEELKSFYKTYTEMTSWPEIFDKKKILRPIKKLGIKIGAFFEKTPVLSLIYKHLILPVSKNFEHPEVGTGTLNMVFSDNIFMSMDTRKTRRNNNVMVIGGSGTGKSRFFVKPNVLQANCSYIITDPSGELLESEGTFLVNEGYELRVFNLVEMEHSNCYNPFHYIRNQEGVLIMINALIKNTTPKGASSSDPFWEKAETALLQAICFFLVSECNKEDQNFSNVMKLLRCAKAVEGQEDVDSTLDIMFKDLAEREPEHIAVQSYAVFKSAGGGKTAQSILISCQTRLQTFNLDAIKNLTSVDNIDLGSVGDKKVALFCITPSADTTFNYLVALLYTQLFETLYHHAETECPGKRLKSHVRFLLDEFANVGTIPDFAQKLATMRKYEISCSIIIQALSQIKAMYKDDWEVLMGNCDSQLFLGGADATTLEYISKQLGKETIRSINNSKSYGKQGSYSLSYNKSGRELMTPDELRVMDNENCILFIRGLHPFFSKKFPLEKHVNYKDSGDGNKKLLFDVKTQLTTGQKVKELNFKESDNLKIFKEAQISDTREADLQHRFNSRPVEMISARGRELHKPKQLAKEVPGIELPLAERTPEQALAVEEFMETTEFDHIAQLSAKDLQAYQQSVFEEFYATNDYEDIERGNA